MRCLRELEVAGDVGFPYLLRVLEFKYNTCKKKKKKKKKKSCEIDNQDVPLALFFIIKFAFSNINHPTTLSCT